MKRIIIIIIVAFVLLSSLISIKQALSGQEITNDMDLIITIEDDHETMHLVNNPLDNSLNLFKDISNRWSKTTNKMSSFILNIENSAHTWVNSIGDDFTKVDWSNWGQNTSEYGVKFNGLASYIWGILKGLATPITFALLGISGVVGAIIILISFFF